MKKNNFRKNSNLDIGVDKMIAVIPQFKNSRLVRILTGNPRADNSNNSLNLKNGYSWDMVTNPMRYMMSLTMYLHRKAIEEGCCMLYYNPNGDETPLDQVDYYNEFRFMVLNPFPEINFHELLSKCYSISKEVTLDDLIKKNLSKHFDVNKLDITDQILGLLMLYGLYIMGEELVV